MNPRMSEVELQKLIESYIEHGDPILPTLQPISDQIELDIAIAVGA